MEGEDGNNVSEKTSQVPASKNEQTIVIALDASDQAESAVKCTYNVTRLWISPKLPAVSAGLRSSIRGLAFDLQQRAADTDSTASFNSHRWALNRRRTAFIIPSNLPYVRLVPNVLWFMISKPLY